MLRCGLRSVWFFCFQACYEMILRLFYHVFPPSDHDISVLETLRNFHTVKNYVTVYLEEKVQVMYTQSTSCNLKRASATKSPKLCALTFAKLAKRLSVFEISPSMPIVVKSRHLLNLYLVLLKLQM